MYCSESLIKNIPSVDINDQEKLSEFIVKSDICFGILTKRGNASVKSMLKAYKLEESYADHMKLS